MSGRAPVGSAPRAVAAPTLALRCEGSAAIGLGHVMRAMALAQAARARGLEPRFVMNADGITAAIPVGEGFALDSVPPGLSVDAESKWLAGRLAPGAWVVVDGYGLGALVLPLRARGLRVCAIHDAPGGPGAAGYADILVDPGLPAVASGGLTLGRRLLFGPRYAPLRAAFRHIRLRAGNAAADVPRPVRLLVLSGGSDVAGMTVRVLVALRGAGADLPALEAQVVLGPAAAALPAELVGVLSSRLTVEVVRAPRDLPDLMARADLAITAAGTSVLELLCLGVPPLMVTVVGNQGGVAAAVEAARAGIDIGPPEAIEGPALGAAVRRALAEHDALSQAGQRLVDGGGARRVLAAMADFTRAGAGARARGVAA